MAGTDTRCQKKTMYGFSISAHLLLNKLLNSDLFDGWRKGLPSLLLSNRLLVAWAPGIVVVLEAKPIDNVLV